MKLIKLKSLSLSPKRLFRPAGTTRSGRRSPSSSNHLDGSFSSSISSSSTSSSTSASTSTVLTRRDLEALLGRLGAGECSQVDVESMLRDIGLGVGVGDGVGIDELVGRLGTVCGGGKEEEELRQAFEFFDEDGDGRITAEELLGVLSGVMGDEGCTLEDCRRMIAGVDGNRDGFVCFEDFTRMMQLQIGA